MRQAEDIPLEVSYTDADVVNASKYDKWTEGRYRLKLTGIVKDISKANGHLMFVARYRVLKDPNDPMSIFGSELRHYQCLPFRNPNRTGHVPKKFFATSTTNWLASHTDEVKATPRKTEDGFLYDGEIIDNAALAGSKKEALDSGFSKADELWNDQSGQKLEQLLESVVFADIYYQVNKETGEVSDFPSLRNFAAELADGDELVPADMMIANDAATDEDEAADEEVEVPEEAPAPKKLAKKTPAKPVKGKGRK